MRVIVVISKNQWEVLRKRVAVVVISKNLLDSHPYLIVSTLCFLSFYIARDRSHMRYCVTYFLPQLFTMSVC